MTKRNLFAVLLFFALACSPDVEITPEPPKPAPPGDPLSSCATCSDGTRLVLRPRGYTSPDGLEFRVGSTIVDTARKETCAPRLAEDNVLRCLPEVFFGPFGFADPLCSQRIAIVPPAQLCAGTPKYVADLPDHAPTCVPPKSNTIFEIGAAHAGPIYQENSGACADVTSTYAGSSAFLFGAKVSAAEFAVVEAHE